MLKSKILTAEEIRDYMEGLKKWLEEERDTPAEGMTDFFSGRLESYENVHLHHWGEEYAHIADYFEDNLTTLLDIGCGTGLELEAMFRRFPHLRVTGIDLSADMLGKLTQKYGSKQIETVAADYFAYPFEEKQYDAALSFETLHHFPYEKKQGIYDKLYKAIAPGGYYIECNYIACCDEEEQICLANYEYKRSRSNISADTYVHIDIPLTPEHQMALMRNAGFEAVQILYQNGGTVIFKAEKAL